MIQNAAERRKRAEQLTADLKLFRGLLEKQRREDPTHEVALAMHQADIDRARHRLYVECSLSA